MAVGAAASGDNSGESGIGPQALEGRDVAPGRGPEPRRLDPDAVSLGARIESMNHQVRDAVWTSVPVKIVVFCPVAIGTPGTTSCAWPAPSNWDECQPLASCAPCRWGI